MVAVAVGPLVAAAREVQKLNRDREKLLAVVESGFGDLPPFNRAVRDLLGVTLSNLRKKKSTTSKIMAFSLRESSKKKAKGPAGELEPAENSSQI